MKVDLVRKIGEELFAQNSGAIRSRELRDEFVEYNDVRMMLILNVDSNPTVGKLQKLEHGALKKHVPNF